MWIAAVVTVGAGSLLVIDQATDGDRLSVLFLIIMVGFTLALFLRAGSTITHRRQEAELVRSQISALRARLATLPPGSKDAPNA